MMSQRCVETRLLSLRFKTLLMIIPVLCWTGCLKPRTQEPFTEQSIDLLVKSRKEYCSLTDKTDGQNNSMNVDQDTMNKFVQALRPIKSTKQGAVDAAKVDYELLFNAGRAPVQFEIRLNGDQIEYSENGSIYEGGNAKEFKKIVEDVLKRESGERK